MNRSIPQPHYRPWKPYDRFHLRRRFARMHRRPFCPVWLSDYDIARSLRDTRSRRRALREPIYDVAEEMPE